MTTHIARVLERYTIPLEVPDGEHEEWFLDWVLRAPSKAGRHLTAGWLAYSSLLSVYPSPGELDTVHESFGGMGAQSLMIQELFAPDNHSVGEYAPDGVRHLEKLLAPCDGVGVHQWDAYVDPPPAADLYGLDFGDLTAWKTRDGQPHRKLLDEVFAFEPKAVVFTDIACRYLHLHRERYESILGGGTCASYGTYLRALLARLEVLYGYSLVAGYWDRWSTVMAVVPSELVSNRGALQETPDEPVGLEIL